ncbi:MAG: TetR/AcrR family transcriptional regulator [Deltaproteobacteria bacterium]|nr:TetR/AcrR family transcriptional regulator [Deltaproteobacteria bacterium]
MPEKKPRVPADETRARLRAAAAELFRERPPGEVSVREIAQRAGVNHGLVHRLYGGKDALVLAVLRQVFRETGEAIAARAAQDFEAALASGLDVLLRERWIAGVIAHALARGDLNQLPVASMTPLVRQLHGEPLDDDLAALTALGEAAALGWMLFEPFITRGSSLGGMPQDARSRLFVRALARAVGSPTLSASSAPPAAWAQNPISAMSIPEE